MLHVLWEWNKKSKQSRHPYSFYFSRNIIRDKWIRTEISMATQRHSTGSMMPAHCEWSATRKKRKYNEFCYLWKIENKMRYHFPDEKKRLELKPVIRYYWMLARKCAALEGGCTVVCRVCVVQFNCNTKYESSLRCIALCDVFTSLSISIQFIFVYLPAKSPCTHIPDRTYLRRCSNVHRCNRN